MTKQDGKLACWWLGFILLGERNIFESALMCARGNRVSRVIATVQASVRDFTA